MPSRHARETVYAPRDAPAVSLDRVHGIASLVGVIVSHVIVLFDFIEEAHERGESLEE